jgi:ATP-dependent DNA ligase
MLATLRPQKYAKGSSARVANPIVEPLWTGVRTLAAVDDGGAALVDAEGQPVPGMDAILDALVAAVRAVGIVVDGFVTKQGGPSGSGLSIWSDEMPSMSGFIGLRRNRAVDTVHLKEGAADAVTFGPDDEIRLVVTDLLWLDDASLLDVPLLERRRLLEGVLVESDVIRVGAYIRPPVETWLGSWRAQGFQGATYKAANSRYLPGAPNPDWVVSGMPRR